MIRVHEDKIVRVSDEIRLNARQRQAMRNDIKEFELLCKDINSQCLNEIDDFSNKFLD